MKNVKILLYFFVFILSHSISAQNFSIKAGALYNDVELKVTTSSSGTLFPRSDLGFYAGVSFKRPIGEFLAVRTELLYMQKGLKQPVTSIQYNNVTHNYLALPVLIRIDLPIKIALEIGAEPAYWVSSNLFKNGISISDKFDLGLTCGISFMITDKFEFTTRYTHSIKPYDTFNLTDASGNDNGKYEFFHRNIHLGAGYYF